MAVQNPVVVVPGITASRLHDEYELPPETVWSAVLNKSYDRISLHPDDVRYELREPSRVRSSTAYPFPYGDLVEELRHNLTSREDQPTPVYPFHYDWRQPLDRAEILLEAFVIEVVDRTRLMRHYARTRWIDDPRVDLVGHSMGGLIVTGYLERLGGAAPIGKVATLGTPYLGSFEAPIKVVTGTASLGTESPNSRERESARLTPALYHLLPSFPNAVDAPEGVPSDLFQVGAWQPGVTETLAEFIRLHGLKPGNRAARERRATEVLAAMLAMAQRHRERVERFSLESAGLDPSRWLCVVGVDSETRVTLKVRTVHGKPRFLLSSDDRRNEWPGNVLTGDGTVPYLGAKPPFLRTENLVCVRPADFGYWELRDRGLLAASAFHGLLPVLNLAHRLITRFLKGQAGDDSVWARPAPDIGDSRWDPPISQLRRKV